MTTYTPTQLANYAQNAGFTGNDLVTIVAIAMAESGGRTDAINSTDPFGGSYGVLQINGAHISGLSGNAISMACATDAQCSFNYGYSLFKSQGFQPWGTYTSGAYKSFLNGQGTVSVASGANTTPTSTNASSSLQGVVSSLSGLWAWASNPLRLIKMVVGFLLIAGALYLLISPDAESAVKSVVEAAPKE